jgi:hypothetical protein
VVKLSFFPRAKKAIAFPLNPRANKTLKALFLTTNGRFSLYLIIFIQMKKTIVYVVI